MRREGSSWRRSSGGGGGGRQIIGLRRRRLLRRRGPLSGRAGGRRVRESLAMVRLRKLVLLLLAVGRRTEVGRSLRLSLRVSGTWSSALVLWRRGGGREERCEVGRLGCVRHVVAR